jgi:hypothetical protein
MIFLSFGKVEFSSVQSIRQPDDQAEEMEDHQRQLDCRDGACSSPHGLCDGEGGSNHTAKAP